MAVVNCPECRNEIPSADINVSTDLAMCRRCNATHSFSELFECRNLVQTLEDSPPPSGFTQRTTARGVAYRVSHRSLLGAAGALAICLFWNGIVSVFVLVNLASTLNLLGITVPEWFPAPVMNGETMGLGMTLFLWLFLTPFLIVGAGFMGAFLMVIGGHTEVRINAAEGRIFTGVGPIGWPRKFKPHEVRSVALKDSNWRDSDGDRHTKQEIVLEMNNGDTLKFGRGMKEARRAYLAALLQRTLV
jgi:hypothetical protein